MSRICVVGLGYIGLPTAAMLASRGHEVIGCDIRQYVISEISEGRAHFHEPDLQMLLSAAVQTGRLRAQTVPAEADYFILAVPTPLSARGKPDLSFVEAATDSVAPLLKRGNTVILESTSPVGTTERLAAQLQRARPDLALPRYQEEGDPDTIDVFVAHCPERVMPGQMVRELVSNDRIIGGMTDECAKRAAEIYESFVSAQMLVTDCRTAELVKLVENSFRDVNIAFANELSLICDRVGVNVWRAIELANRHPRVNILRPGCGVGGHCIAVDPLFLIDAAPEQAQLMRTAREVNDEKPRWIVNQLQAMSARFREPIIACYGIAYKPDVDDLRESPGLKIVEQLAERPDVQLLVVEPNIRELPPTLQNRHNVALTDADTARQRADIAAFLVGHRSFYRMDKSLFLSKAVLDTIGIMA